MRQSALPVLLLIGLVPALASALDWPVEKKIVAGTFGEYRDGRFNDGLDIGGGEQDVRAVLPGEVVFHYDENSDYSSLPRGLGSFMALYHDGSVETIYSHLKKGTLDPSRPRYAAGERLGVAGDTGHTNGTQLHLTVYDLETASSVNPLTLLPPVADTQMPVIRKVYLSMGDVMEPLDNGSKVPAGRAEIIAEAYDLRQDVKFHWPIAPYSVRLTFDGKELWKAVFDSIQAVDGRFAISATRLSIDAAYTRDGLLKCGTAELRPGSSRLILSVRDFAGNETTKEISFTVRE